MRNGFPWQLVLYGEACCASALAVSFALPAAEATAQANQRITVSGYVSPRCWAISSFTATETPAQNPRGPVTCSNGSASVRIERQDMPTDLPEGTRPHLRVTVSPKT